jgi:hypothetical protein
MITPEKTNWSLAQFTEIKPKSTFSSRNSFCDENGNAVSDGFSLTKNSFQAGTEKTTVHIEKKFNKLSTLEMMTSGGYKEGLIGGYANLDEYLRTVVTSK